MLATARYVTAQPPTQGADAGMYDASSEIHKLSTIIQALFAQDNDHPLLVDNGSNSVVSQSYPHLIQM